MHGTLTRVDPPETLAYASDTHGEVGFDLRPDGDGCRLLLTGALPVGDQAAGTLAGWHVHVDLLSRALDGAPGARDRERWTELRDRYAATLG